MRIVCLCLVIILPFCLLSCSQERGVKEIFDEFSKKYGSLPCGVLYSSEREEWEDGYFSDKMRQQLFAREDGTSELEHVSEYCVYLGSYNNEFYELGIFLCASHSEAQQVAKMCLRRIDTVKGLRSMHGTAVSLSSLSGAFVQIYGKYCVYSIMPDNATAESAFNSVF